ncbi:MAG: HAD-IA family hydrolase [Desulfurococcaceae archaeon]
MENREVNCIVLIDVDGTLIPSLIDFESLREQIRRLLGVNDTLRPLGARLAALPIPNELKDIAWSIIERAEIESVEHIDIKDLEENIKSVRHIKEIGFKVVIITARSRLSLKLILEKLGINKYVDMCVTRDLNPERKAQLRYIKTLFEREKARIIFIGDSVYDEEASRELGIEFIKVNNYRELPGSIEKAISVCINTLDHRTGFDSSV